MQIMIKKDCKIIEIFRRKMLNPSTDENKTVENERRKKGKKTKKTKKRRILIQKKKRERKRKNWFRIQSCSKKETRK